MQHLLLGPSTSVVTSFDLSFPTVATFTTLPALTSSSSTMCVNVTFPVSPGANSPSTIAVCSTEFVSVTSTSVNVTFPVFVTCTVYVIVSPYLYSLSPLVTLFTNATPSLGPSTSVVTSFDLSFPTVATFTTLPALTSSSSTMCVNVTFPVAPGANSPSTIAVCSTEFVSVTSTSVNVTFPVFVTCTVYVIVSPYLYSLSPLVTLFTNVTPSLGHPHLL